jgi:putative ABC transport system ATP-binding protein
VTFDVLKGEFVAIMGPSGSGKSTLMNILGCLDVPSTGSYELDGVEVSLLNDDQQARIRNQKIGFVFQGFNLLRRQSALDQVMLPLLYTQVDQRKERAMAALEMVGLAERMDHKPTELSGGQQQRVAIARALVTNPALVLADEPTGNLDSFSSNEIMAILQELNSNHGITVVLVTHENDIAQHTQRIIRVKDGLVQADGPVTHRIFAQRAAAGELMVT